MAITAADVVLVASEGMTDLVDGGGRMTGDVIESGSVGTLYPRISRVDAVAGRVNLRKVYLAVQTATQDTYSGAHAIVCTPPADPKQGMCLFSTEDHFDTRTEARNFIESYVVRGVETNMVLMGDQFAGQSAISVYQRVDAAMPEVGEVYCLDLDYVGYTPAQQYVRIMGIEYEDREFDALSGSSYSTFTRRVITLSLSSALQTDFPGVEPSLGSTTRPTKIRSTTVADAARYFATKPLTEAGVAGALGVSVGSPLYPLCPSVTKEIPISLLPFPGASVRVGSGSYAYTLADTTLTTTAGEHTVAVYFPITFRTGAVNLLAGASDPVPISWADGEITTPALPTPVSPYGLSLLAASIDGNVLTLSYLAGGAYARIAGAASDPAAEISGSAHTKATEITIANRGTVYSEVLSPPPALGSGTLSYRSMGRWYTLTDNGAGEWVGNSINEGIVNVTDPVNGGVVATLGYDPDLGSALIWSWGSGVHYPALTGTAQECDTTLRLPFAIGAGVVPNSLSVAYTQGGASKSAADGSTGAITGHCTGQVEDYATGTGYLLFSTPPDVGSTVTISYESNLAAGYSGPCTADGLAIQCPGAGPWANTGSLSLQWGITQLGWSGVLSTLVYVQNNGSVWSMRNNANLVHTVYAELTEIGTFDALTGQITLTGVPVMWFNRWDPTGMAWVKISIDPLSISLFAVGNADMAPATPAPDGAQSYPISLATTGLQWRVSPVSQHQIVAGSLAFRLTGRTYYDDGAGGIVYNVDPLTGAGTTAGTVDYASGTVSLQSWVNDSAVAVVVYSALGVYGEWTAESISFRTHGSPLRAGSFYVHGDPADGTARRVGTAGVDGTVSGTVTGNVNQEYGWGQVAFGAEVDPASIRYSAVITTSLPQDADLVGVSSERLSASGTVPVYRSGDLVVTHYTGSDAIPSPVAGATYALSVPTGLPAPNAPSLAWIKVVDATGAAVADAQWTGDLAAYEVTMADPMDLSAYTLPLTVYWRCEDMALVTDSQLDGSIALSAPLSWDYPAGAWLSSAARFGDLFASVTSIHDMTTWTGVWSDAQTGSDSPSAYNYLTYPIEVSNEHAVRERWRLSFTSSTAFQVIGEKSGIIATGSTAVDCEPINPTTGGPYFVIRAAGWGTWSTGYQLRFNTLPGSAPIWSVRTVLPGARTTAETYGIEVRGDVD